MTQRATAPSPLAAQDWRILVVDDSATMRSILTGLLGKIGVATSRQAATAVEAFGVLQTAPIDLVLCDIEMEPHGGFYLLRAVRSVSTLAALSFVMVTASRQQQHVTCAKRDEADAYLLKPFNAARLLETIGPLISGQGSGKAQSEARTLTATQAPPQSRRWRAGR